MISVKALCNAVILFYPIRKSATLFGNLAVNGSHHGGWLKAVYGTGLFQALPLGGRAAQAMHSDRKQHIGRLRIVVDDLSDQGLSCYIQFVHFCFLSTAAKIAAAIIFFIVSYNLLSDKQEFLLPA